MERLHQTSIQIRVAVPPRYRPLCAIGLALVAIAIRIPLLHYRTSDYLVYKTWFDIYEHHGGFTALQWNFTNYNEPFLYVLASLTYVASVPLLGIKVFSLLCELLLAGVTYSLVRVMRPTGLAPLFASVCVLSIPTVIINGSLWGQVDSAYTAFGLAGLTFIVRRRPVLATACFGVALAFKLQAIFFFPILLPLLLRRWLRVSHLALIPAMVVLLDIPALSVGAPVSTIWSPYIQQISGFQQLTLNAPNVYQYFSATTSPSLRTAGIVFTAVILLALALGAAFRGAALTPTHIVLMATVSVLATPFFLPAMHERYFYPADVLTLVTAICLPRLWPLPLIEQFASLFSYMPYLSSDTVQQGVARLAHRFLVSFDILSTAMLVATTLALLTTIWHFRWPSNERDAFSKRTSDFPRENGRLGGRMAREQLPFPTQEHQIALRHQTNIHPRWR